MSLPLALTVRAHADSVSLWQDTCADTSEAAGTLMDGNVRHGARLLRSSIQHLSGPYSLTPDPRGSFNSLAARPLASFVPGPDEVNLQFLLPPSM